MNNIVLVHGGFVDGAVPADLRYAAICGSAEETSKHPCAVTIFPLSGVVVKSALFGMWSG